MFVTLSGLSLKYSRLNKQRVAGNSCTLETSTSVIAFNETRISCAQMKFATALKASFTLYYRI